MFCAVSSPCIASALDPAFVHRNIVGRDIGVKIFDICRRISGSLPIDVHFYCTDTSKNLGVVTEGPAAQISPLTVTNSTLWRNGPAAFLRPNFPEEENVFMSFADGEFVCYNKPSDWLDA